MIHNNNKLKTFTVMAVCNRLMSSIAVRTVIGHY